MDKPINGGYVKWSSMIGVFSLMVLIPAGFYAYVLNLHAQHPHEGAVRIEQIKPIEDHLVKLDIKIDKLQETINNMALQMAKNGVHNHEQSKRRSTHK